MNRRDFLKSCTYTLAASGFSGIPGLSMALGQCPSGAMSRTVVNIMLEGGADLRYLFVPKPDSTSAYVTAFWSARKNLYVNNSLYAGSYEAMYAAEYDTVTTTDRINNTTFQFGVHKSSGWLKQQIEAGRVAIVPNVLGSDSRRHDHSQLVSDAGDHTISGLDYNRSGWGGRLVESIGGTSVSAPNVVAITPEVTLYCNGSVDGSRLINVIHARDTRDAALHAANSADVRSLYLTRALSSYYRQRGQEIKTDHPSTWVFRRFFDYHESFRNFGDSLNARLGCAPIPNSLQSNVLRTYDGDFAQQCRNIYDCALAPDILDVRAISMKYGGWDMHVNLQSRINNNLSDLFGAIPVATGGGLATVHAELSRLGVTSNLVYVFNSDFGRQLAANGSYGTDHGRGSYSIIIADATNINGGIYGNMFPEDPAKFSEHDTDIVGLTALERVLARVSDWVSPGSGNNVFPGNSALMLEVNPSYISSMFKT